MSLSISTTIWSRVSLRGLVSRVSSSHSRRMHLPAVNRETDPTILHRFIHDNPLGLITTSIRSPSYPLLQSSHVPWIVDPEFEGMKAGGFGQLRGHMARQNPQAKAIIESLNATSPGSSSHLEDDILIIFNGPLHHYITPHFYRETKPSTGKVVPTWDYEAVQVYGKAKIYHDSQSADTGAFLAKQLDDLTQQCETSIMGYGREEGKKQPWKVDDAPERYLEVLKSNIIGVEIEITSIAGRFKWSQEKPVGDRDGVVIGFRELKTELGTQLADTITRTAEKFDAQKAAKKLERS